MFTVRHMLRAQKDVWSLSFSCSDPGEHRERGEEEKLVGGNVVVLKCPCSGILDGNLWRKFGNLAIRE